MNKLLSFIFILFFSNNILSQDFKEILDINNIRIGINPNGKLFNNDSTGKVLFEFPKNSGKNLISQHNLIISSVNINNYKPIVSGEGFGRDFQTGQLPFNNNDTLSVDSINYYNRVWTLTKEQIDYHKAHYNDLNYNIHETILTWPIRLNEWRINEGAPFVDTDSNFIYNPENGDYPSIKGDKCIFFVFNPLKTFTNNNTSHKIEIYTMVYAYNSINDEAFKNTIFIKYKIINRSDINYYDTYLSFYNNFNIGNPNDDYVGCDINRNLSYSYNGNAYDSVYGINPPVQGFVILKGIQMNPDGIDNPRYDSNGNFYCDLNINGTNFGDSIIDNEILGMNRQYFPIPTINYTNQNDSFIEKKLYNISRGRQLNENYITYGGDGFNNNPETGVNCHFMYPANTDSCNWGTNGIMPLNKNWTELTANNSPGERLSFTITGPCTLIPQEDIHSIYEYTLEVAFITAYGNDSIQGNIYKLLSSTDTIIKYYKLGSLPNKINKINNTNNNIFDIKIYPNPAINSVNINISNFDKPFQAYIYNVNGVCVKTFVINNRISNININELKNEFYFIKFENESNNIYKLIKF